MTTVFVLGAGSDIGCDLALRYADAGAQVIGTYRTDASAARLVDVPNIHLLRCNIAELGEVANLALAYAELDTPWDIFISSVGTMEPIGPFFECDFTQWERSVTTNSLAQLRILHALHPYRRRSATSHVAFFAGGGTNGPFASYSAYCASKIFLIKMCELLSDENPDLNVFILGPGFLPTKIHNQTFSNPMAAGSNYAKTVRFYETSTGTAGFADVYQCINWCVQAGRPVAAGRNVSVVHDAWRDGGHELAATLVEDRDKFKLRRYGNTA